MNEVIPLIKSKNDAEILLMVFMKYFNGSEVQTRLFRMTISWSNNSIKPFKCNIFKRNNGEELIFFTFRKAIDWIYANRLTFNDLINRNNHWGWGQTIFNPVGNSGGLE